MKKSTAAVTAWVVMAAGCSSEIAFPEFEGVSLASMLTVAGSSADDLWLAGCQGGKFAALHYDGSWSVVATVEGMNCLNDNEQTRNFVSGGPGWVWVAGYKLLRIGEDGTVEDHSAEVLGADYLGSVGNHLYGSTSRDSKYSVFHMEGGKPLADLLSGADFPGPLVVAATDDIWHTDNGSGELQHFDGSTWTTVANGPFLHTIGLGFPRNDTWAGQTETMHWDGTAWTTVPLPPLEGAPGFLIDALVPDGNGSFALVGKFFANGTGSYAGNTTSYAVIRRNGDAWEKPEIVAVRSQTACSGSGACGVHVRGRLQDGTFVVSAKEMGEDPVIVTFKP